MDFEFSEEQQLIGSQARSFLQKECSGETVRGVLEGDAPYDKTLWQKIGDMGWLGTSIPEEYGGLGLSYLELAVIAEAIGRSLAPVPFSTSVYLATELILTAGSEKQKQHWLPKLATGEAIGTAALQCALTIDSDDNVVGKMKLVPDAEVASFSIALANNQDSDQLTLCLIELDQAALAIKPATPIDLTRSVADVHCEQIKAERLNISGDNRKKLDQILQRAAVLYAWEQIGGADAALEQARDYALERFAFGRPIASFQAIKHKLAQAYVKNTLARSNAYYAIWSLDNDSTDLPQAAATARVSAIQAYYYAAKENIQTHGGMGFTWEFDCHLHYRRAKSLSLVIGGENTWKQRLVRSVL